MTSNVTYRQGVDFFESTCQVIAFICSCTSERSIDFVRQVEEHFPYVDIFKNRKQKPGTLELWGNSKRSQRYILGLFAQYSRDDDTITQRLGWFESCLKKITKQLPTLKSIAFPRKNKTSGCTTCKYLRAIETWAKTVPHIEIEIIDIESPHERYLNTPKQCGDTNTSNEVVSPQTLTTPDEYFEKPEYIKIENEVYEWITQHTNMDDIPTNSEMCSKLAMSLSEVLLKDNSDLYGKIKAVVPVEDDFFSILEQQASNSDLNRD